MGDYSIIRVLVCDDNANCTRTFSQALIGAAIDVAYDTSTAIAMLNSDRYFNVVFLDYDFDEVNSENNGTVITQWLIQHPDKQPSAIFIIHSCNKLGRLLMMDDLIEAKRNFILMEPFSWQDPEFNLDTIRDILKNSEVRSTCDD